MYSQGQVELPQSFLGPWDIIKIGLDQSNRVNHNHMSVLHSTVYRYTLYIYIFVYTHMYMHIFGLMIKLPNDKIALYIYILIYNSNDNNTDNC
jgi:hypothetical protein